MTEDDANVWNEHAAAYGRFVDQREQGDLAADPVLSRLLDLLGDLDGRDALDAGCGEGFLARILATRGARVTGVDPSPRLIELARVKDPRGAIDYRVADLSRPVPELVGRFDRIGSHLVLDEVADHRGFAATLASIARPGARLALAFNNPYASVVRGEIPDYFANGARGPYAGLAALGISAHYYHRTLEEYLDAFLTAGFRLARLADIPDQPGVVRHLPVNYRFPRFTVLAFDRP